MISFDHVSKQFIIRHGNSQTLQELFVYILSKVSSTAPPPVKPSFVKILDNISFTVDRGEVLGIIGPNGAGKSTTLKLAAGVIHPDSGRISVAGRVAGLLELGAGFHPDLTGRENIYLYGSIMGLNRKRIETQLQEIIEFAGITQFIDVPVRDYSSGMFARLAFAVSIHVDAEILLIDEVLSVGDADFRTKSFQRILDHRNRGGTILFISHQMSAIKQLCDRVLLLQNGHIAAEGPPEPVIKEYLNLVNQSRQSKTVLQKQSRQSPTHIEAIHLLDASGAPCQNFKSGAPARLRICIEIENSIPDLLIQAQVHTIDNRLMHGTNSARHQVSLEGVLGKICVEVAYQSLNLIPGSYYFRIRILPLHEDQDNVPFSICPFEISGSKELGVGLVSLPHQWQKVHQTTLEN